VGKRGGVVALLAFGGPEAGHEGLRRAAPCLSLLLLAQEHGKDLLAIVDPARLEVGEARVNVPKERGLFSGDDISAIAAQFLEIFG
jgi:hypothetical protein